MDIEEMSDNEVVAQMAKMLEEIGLALGDYDMTTEQDFAIDYAFQAADELIALSAVCCNLAHRVMVQVIDTTNSITGKEL